MSARVEVVPVANGSSLLPLWARRHFTRRRAANNTTEWHSMGRGKGYATRAGAVAAARHAAESDRLWVHVLDEHGRILRMIEPTR